jgi:hypothetical protein
MLQAGFIEGLKWLGRKGLVFDLGIDQHSGGKWQLEEAAEMIEKAHESVKEEEKVTIIISELLIPLLVPAADSHQITSASQISQSTTPQTQAS